MARVPKAVYAWAAVAIGAATTAGISLNWDQLFAVPANRVITLFYTHRCACFHGWSEHLEAGEFIVRTHEMDNLAPIRERLKDRVENAGCHVAALDGYFVEGHVTAEDLRQLVRARPLGVGISIQGNPSGLPGLKPGEKMDSYNVLVHQADGSSEIWLSHAGAATK